MTTHFVEQAAVGVWRVGGLLRTFSARWIFFWGDFLGRREGRFAPGYLILGLQPVGAGNLGDGILIPAS